MENKETNLNDTQSKGLSTAGKDLLRSLFSLSAEAVLQRILEQDNPREFVQRIPTEDFFWLVKKVGEADCVPLLKLASDTQKQYVLDLELWQKDRLDIEKASDWLGRMHLADPEGLIRWLRSSGENLSYYYFFKAIQVEVKTEDEIPDVDERFFTLDGIFYVKVRDETRTETVKNILRTLAADNLDRYQAFLSMLAGVIPAELEEELYRWRNVRLAEHGFLPPEEARIVYAPMDPGALKTEAEDPSVSGNENADTVGELVAVFPLAQAGGRNILNRTISGVEDPIFMDRLRLEFAGLCNQLLSADGMPIDDMDVLIRSCRRAAAHLNLALEKICGTDTAMAEKMLRRNTLVSIFRAGFGLVLDLKWEAERWLRDSWFSAMGLAFDFWGDAWGGRLSGIVRDRPELFTGKEGADRFRAFESLFELEEARAFIREMQALDTMLKHMTRTHPLETRFVEKEPLTCRQVLFHLWARRVLGLKPGFDGITQEQVVAFFRRIRSGEEGPPYRVSAAGAEFVNDFMAYARDMAPGMKKSLEDALFRIWQEFSGEYEWVETDDLEGRFMQFLVVVPGAGE